jgi:hypothetical protein
MFAPFQMNHNIIVISLTKLFPNLQMVNPAPPKEKGGEPAAGTMAVSEDKVSPPSYTKPTYARQGSKGNDKRHSS